MSELSEVIVPLRYAREAVPRVTHMRSTSISASVRTLEKHGFLSQYLANLPSPAVARQLQEMLSATWVPADVARSHYAAIDALHLSDATCTEIASDSGGVVEGYLTTTLTRMSRGAGLTPWLFHPHAQRFWDRLCQGGDVGVTKLGPKEALIELHGLPVSRSAYFRLAVRVTCTIALARVCKKVYMREVAHDAFMISYRQSWV